MNPATRSPRAFGFRMIDSVEAVDRYHVKIKLKEPFGPFLSSLTVRNCPIIPAGIEPTPTKPAPGTGPFVFKSFVPNETSEYTRFDKYWEVDENTGDRLPYLDPLNHVQVELLREHRAQNPDEQVLRGIQLTINGISAGLRNSG